MKISEMMISIVLIGAMMTGGGLVISELGTNYGQAVPGNFNPQAFNQSTELNAKLTELQSQTTGQASQFDPLKYFSVLNLVFFSTASNIIAIPQFFINIVTEASVNLGGVILPMWFILAVTTIVLIVVTVKVISIVSGREI